MESDRLLNVKDLLGKKITCTAIYSRSNKDYSGQKRLCLMDIQLEGEQILDHLWVIANHSFKMRGGELIKFDITLIKRKRPGPTLTSGPIIDIQAKNPLKLKLIKRR